MRVAEGDIGHGNSAPDRSFARRSLGDFDRAVSQGRSADSPEEVDLQVQQFANVEEFCHLLRRLQFRASVRWP